MRERARGVVKDLFNRESGVDEELILRERESGVDEALVE